jgi:hypothetical protein
MEEAKPVNGQINLAKWIPEFVGKVFGPWLVPAPEWGPGQKKHSEQPHMTAEERAAIEPPQHVERPALPQQIERNSALVLPVESIRCFPAGKSAARETSHNLEPELEP